MLYLCSPVPPSSNLVARLKPSQPPPPPPPCAQRRRAQNRASQRAYRERKEQRIRDLEQELHESNQREQSMNQAYLALQAENARLRAEHHSDASGSPSAAAPPPSVGSAFDAPADMDASDVKQEFHLTMDVPGFPHQM